MQTLVKSDIFFFIVSIESIVLAILLSVILFYVARAAKLLYQLTETLQERVKDSEEFVAELRERLEGNPVFRFFFPRPRAKKK